MSLIAAGNMVKRELKPLTGLSGPKWFSSLMMNQGSHAGVAVNQDTAVSLSTVFNALNLIGENVGQIDAHIKITENGRKRNYTEHAAYPLILHSPNRYMHAFTFKKLLLNHVCRFDNAFALIERDRNQNPVSLIPIHPDRVQIQVTAAQDIVYLVDGSYVISAINMIHIIGYTEDGLSGKPRIEVVRNSLGNALAAEKFTGEFFSKGVNVSGFIKIDNQLKDQTAIQRLKTSFIKAVTGGSFGVGVLENGADWIDNEVKPGEAQLFENRKINAQVVAHTWNIPLPLLKQMEHATYNNMEQLDIQFGKYTLAPWCTNMGLEFARKLFTEKEKTTGNVKIEWDYSVLMQTDAVSRGKYYESMTKTGAFSPNDILEKEGLNGFNDGDVHVIPSGYQTIEQLIAGQGNGNKNKVKDDANDTNE
jgi:HK97 family phage portal protein